MQKAQVLCVIAFFSTHEDFGTVGQYDAAILSFKKRLRGIENVALQMNVKRLVAVTGIFAEYYSSFVIRIVGSGLFLSFNDLDRAAAAGKKDVKNSFFPCFFAIDKSGKLFNYHYLRSLKGSFI